MVGCSTAPPAPASADPGISEHVVRTGYARISEAYIRPVDIGRIALRGIDALAAVDDSVWTRQGGTGVRVYVSGSQVVELPAPETGDPAAWASVVFRATAAVRHHSEPIRALGAEELYAILFNAAIAELDGYSRYTTADRAANERAQRDGYGGIGITLAFDGKKPTIRTVVPNGPAQRAGLRVGDAIAGIDGTPWEVMDEEGVRVGLRGEPGSAVVLSIARGDEPLHHVTLRRERVVPDTLTAGARDGIGVVKVERFNAATARALRRTVVDLRRALGRSGRGFILDLRGNPGGLLDQAVAAADLFITRGRIIATEGRHPESRQRWDATPDDVADGLPIVVLVDGRSASSAEVLAAALQDSGRAVVVGAGSYGKGTVQTVARLPNGGELFLTWGRIFTPAGYTLHRQGVQPSVCTSRGANSASELVADLRAGRTPSLLQLTSWRSRAADDDEALRHLREACPWREHEPDLDLQVARLLLEEPALYARAVTRSTGSALAER